MAKLVLARCGVCDIGKFLEIVIALAHTRRESQNFVHDNYYLREIPAVNNPLGIGGYPYINGLEVDRNLMEIIAEVSEDLKIEAYFEADEEDGRG